MSIVKIFLIIFLITFATAILVSYVITTIYLFSKFNNNYFIKITTLIGFIKYLSKYKKFEFYRDTDKSFRLENEDGYMYISLFIYPKYKRYEYDSSEYKNRAILLDPISYLIYFVFIFILYANIIFPLKRKTTKNW